MCNYWSLLLLIENHPHTTVSVTHGLSLFGGGVAIGDVLSLSVTHTPYTLRGEVIPVQVHHCIRPNVGVCLHISLYPSQSLGCWKIRRSASRSLFDHSPLIVERFKTFCLVLRRGGDWDAVCVRLLCLSRTGWWLKMFSQSERSFYRLRRSRWCLLFIPGLTLGAQLLSVSSPFSVD